MFTMALLTVSEGGVPPGTYSATFVGTEPQPENKERGFPPGLRWRFKISAGPLAGQIASRVTGPAPSPKNGCGKMLSGLLGRQLTPQEQVDPEKLVGQPCSIVVAPGQMGGTRVEAVVPAPTS
jgi:hypothetical protein